MPKVTVHGKTKHFPYTTKGKALAKTFAKKTGQKVVSKKPIVNPKAKSKVSLTKLIKTLTKKGKK